MRIKSSKAPIQNERGGKIRGGKPSFNHSQDSISSASFSEKSISLETAEISLKSNAFEYDNTVGLGGAIKLMSTSVIVFTQTGCGKGKKKKTEIMSLLFYMLFPPFQSQ